MYQLRVVKIKTERTYAVFSKNIFLFLFLLNFNDNNPSSIGYLLYYTRIIFI